MGLSTIEIGTASVATTDTSAVTGAAPSIAVAVARSTTVRAPPAVLGRVTFVVAPVVAEKVTGSPDTCDQVTVTPAVRLGVARRLTTEPPGAEAGEDEAVSVSGAGAVPMEIESTAVRPSASVAIASTVTSGRPATGHASVACLPEGNPPLVVLEVMIAPGTPGTRQVTVTASPSGSLAVVLSTTLVAVAAGTMRPSGCAGSVEVRSMVGARFGRRIVMVTLSRSVMIRSVTVTSKVNVALAVREVGASNMARWPLGSASGRRVTAGPPVWRQVNVRGGPPIDEVERLASRMTRVGWGAPPAVVACAASTV